MECCKSWVEEAEDQHAALGFLSGGIHRISNPATILEFEHLVLTRCGGSDDEMASLAFHRIAHSLRRHRPNYAHVYNHLASEMFYVQTTMNIPSATLYAAFTAYSGWVTLFVDVMFCLLSPHHLPHVPLHFALFTTAMDLISMAVNG